MKISRRVPVSATSVLKPLSRFLMAATVALVGITVGIPLGIVVGRLIWKAFATNLGAVPVPVVPAWAITALALGVFVGANLLAVIPAVASARKRAVGQLLRTQ